jgi:hypothetical protein
MRVFLTGYVEPKDGTFGSTIGTSSAEIDEAMLTEYPELKEALSKIGERLAGECAERDSGRLPSRGIVGVEFHALEFTLILQRHI